MVPGTKFRGSSQGKPDQKTYVDVPFSFLTLSPGQKKGWLVGRTAGHPGPLHLPGNKKNSLSPRLFPFIQTQKNSSGPRTSGHSPSRWKQNASPGPRTAGHPSEFPLPSFRKQTNVWWATDVPGHGRLGTLCPPLFVETNSQEKASAEIRGEFFRPNSRVNFAVDFLVDFFGPFSLEKIGGKKSTQKSTNQNLGVSGLKSTLQGSGLDK